MRSVVIVGAVFVLSGLTTPSADAGPKGRSTPPPHAQTAKAPKVQHAAKTPHSTTRTNSTRSHTVTNPALASRLQPLLPAGMTADQAAQGFKNQGQFVAALHVSRNLGIPFADLKAEMTGPNRRSLGQAIQQLKPAANGATETRRAQHEADEDLKATRPAKATGKDAHGDRQ